MDMLMSVNFHGLHKYMNVLELIVYEQKSQHILKMKHIINIFALAVIGIWSKDNIAYFKLAYYPVPSDFSVSPTAAQAVGTDGGTIELSIQAGNVGWWIESSQTWCTVSPPTFNLDPMIIEVKQQ